MGCNASKTSETNEKLIDINNYDREKLNDEIISNVERRLRETLANELNSVVIINDFKDVINPEDILNELKKSKNNNDISYENLYDLSAKIIEIYDANICTVKFIYDNQIYQTTIRMDGYSAPEKIIKANTAAKKMEKILSNEVTKKFTELCCSPSLNENEKIIKLDIVKYDKDGKKGAKNIGRIYVDNNVCVNDYMIENKYAYIYGGGEKKKIEDLVDEGYYQELIDKIKENNSARDLLDTDSLSVSIIGDDDF